MASLILFNKPFQVLSQFTDSNHRSTLADFIDQPNVYPAGRLDYDSEGLLLLTDNGALQQRISNPRHKQVKEYWVQVEGQPETEALDQLRQGIVLKDGPTRPAKVTPVTEPLWLWPRQPPIRQRQGDLTSWLKLEISEGRNRQVRRMTAAIGHPTLRLIRTRIADWSLDGLLPGEWRQQTIHMPVASKRQRPGR